MQLVTRKRSAAAALVGGALTLAACGVGGASHVVQGAASAPSVSPQTLSQVDAQLGALDNSLNQANADLNSPQADS